MLPPDKAEPYVTPEENAEVVPKEAFVPEMGERHGNVEELSRNILMLVVISLVGVVVAVVIGFGALVLDQLHFNNQVYRDGYVQPAKTEIKPIVRPDPIFKSIR